MLLSIDVSQERGILPPYCAHLFLMTTTKTTDTAEKKDVTKLQLAIVNGLEDVKAQDIQVFDTEHLSPLFERVIVASGTSNRQTKALAASVRDAVREAGFGKPRIEGEDNGEWIIVDCGAAVAHIMQPTIRQYYRLEELWGEKPVRLKVGAAKPTVGAAAALVDKKSAQKLAKSEAKSEAKSGTKKAATADKKPAKTSAKKSVDTNAVEKKSLKSSAKKPAVKKAKTSAADQRLSASSSTDAPVAKKAAKTTVKTMVVKPAAKKAAAKSSAKSGDTAKAKAAAPRKAAAKKVSTPKA